MSLTNIFGLLGRLYEHVMSFGDPRIKKYSLMESPLPTITLSFTYLLFVKVIGPSMMKNRKPYDLRHPMLFYNFFITALNLYMFWGFGAYGWFGKYDFKCQPLDRSSTNPDAIGMMRIFWLYFFSKFIEFLDTIFFVLRKKDNQVTALHLIHHAAMPFNCWLTVYFAPGGHGSFAGWLNSFVHVVMYSYYGLSAIGPHMSKYLFWKKYITTLQLTQFVMIIVHSVQLFFRECDYPKFSTGYILFFSFVFLLMFSDFYVKAYVKKQSQEGKQQLTNGVNHAAKLSDKLL